PAKTSFLVSVRIVNPRHLLRIGEKILLDKQIMLREEHTKTRMRVVPANNFLVGILFVLDLVNVLPGILGKGDMSATLRGVVALDASFNRHPLMLRAADEHAADFGLHRATGMLADLARDLSFHYHHGLSGYPDFYFGRLCHQCDAPIAIWPNICFLSPAIK